MKTIYIILSKIGSWSMDTDFDITDDLNRANVIFERCTKAISQELETGGNEAGYIDLFEVDLKTFHKKRIRCSVDGEEQVHFGRR